MKYTLAPMEGITTYIVRNAFAHYFPGIDRYYTPFIPAGKAMGKKVIRDILPENNQAEPLIPQLISNDASEVIDMSQKLESYGYREFNINLGCPSGTVVSKRRGSGFLQDPEALRRFFEALYENPRVANGELSYSVKTRIGLKEEEEWESIFSIYLDYPLTELIVHPRLQQDFYRGPVRKEAFDMFYGQVQMQHSELAIAYNGDLRKVQDLERIELQYPELDSIMIGRGLFYNPAVIMMKESGELPPDFSTRLEGFLEEIYQEFCGIFSGEKDAVVHMKEIWCFLGESFPEGKKASKQIKKAKDPADYKAAVRELLQTPFVP